jgi:hypothetical protein
MLALAYHLQAVRWMCTSFHCMQYDGVSQAGTGGSGVASIPLGVTWLKRLGHTPQAPVA